jgi:hypothetical protein
MVMTIVYEMFNPLNKNVQWIEHFVYSPMYFVAGGERFDGNGENIGRDGVFFV